jgi:hypothetical protein
VFICFANYVVEHLEDAESLLTSFGQCLQQLARLMDEHEMSEQVVILSIYLALGLVLYTSKSDTTSKRMERIINYIRMPCLELLCRVSLLKISWYNV